MNDNDQLNDESLAESLLKQFQLSAPTDVKAHLLYHCGVATGEANLKKRGRKSNGMVAAAILLALGVGGLAGWFTNQSTVQNQIANLNQLENSTTNRGTEPPTLAWPGNASQSTFVVRPKNALTAAMDLQQASRTFTQIDATISPVVSEAETSPPFSVGMSNHNLDQLLSF